MRQIALLAITCAVISVPGKACEIDTPTDWLPGFTQAQTERRSSEILEAREHVMTYLQVEADLKNAPTAYLARVLKSDRDESLSIYSTKIEPLKAFKGQLPHGKTLVATTPSSCGFSEGDGSVQFAKEGELVVVFEGLPKREDRPRGIDSIRMIEVTYGSLLGPVQEWLQSQPEYQFRR
jgi:hypothetical protein